MKVLILIGFLVNGSILNTAFSQYSLKKGEAVSAAFSEATPIKLNANYFFLYGLPGRVYTFPEQFHPQKLKRYSQAPLLEYDQNFKLISSADLSDQLPDQIIEGALVRNNNLYIVSSDKTETGRTFYLSSINEACHINGKPTRLFSSDYPAHGIYVCSSFDSSYHLLISLNSVPKKEAQTIDGCITGRDMNVLSKFNSILDFQNNDLLFIHFVLINKNSFGVIYAVKGDKKNDVSCFFSSFDEQGRLLKKTEIDTNGNFIANPVFVDGQQQITLYGLLADKGKDFYGIGMAKIKLPSGETTAFTSSDFQKLKPVKTVNESSFKEISKNGIDKAYMLKTSFIMKDGTNMFIYEKGSESAYQSYFDAARTNPSYKVNRFQHSDILLLKVDTSGNVNWVAVIPREQTESDLTVTGGMVVTKDNRDGIHILFHDSEKNTATDPSEKVKEVNVTYPKKLSVAHVYVSPTGQIKKEFLFSNDSEDEYLSPEYSVGYGNEILFSAAYTRVFKKSSYHFGTIRFK